MKKKLREKEDKQKKGKKESMGIKRKKKADIIKPEKS